MKAKIITGHNCKINLCTNAKRKKLSIKSSLNIGINFISNTGNTLHMFENSELSFEKSAYIKDNAKIVVRKNAELTIDIDTYTNEDSKIRCYKSITIGKNYIIGINSILTNSDMPSINHFCRNKKPKTPVKIGDLCWIGAMFFLGKGSYLKRNVIIGSNSTLINKNLFSEHIYARNPSNKIKKHDNWGGIN